MSMKYLGEVFDIHGGGMDLTFPHHECEIAQSTASQGRESVRHWMHNNMITIKGQKMARSLGNFITLDELFTGTHPLLEKPYSPMTIRFFILQAHYRSTIDFSNEALQAAEKGLERLFAGIDLLDNLPESSESSVDVKKLEENCFAALNDDLNSPTAIAHLFEGVRMINFIKAGQEKITAADLQELKSFFKTMVFDILGLKSEHATKQDEKSEMLHEVINLLLDLRLEVKARKDWSSADMIRDKLNAMGIEIKDTKDGYEWTIR